MSIPIRYIPKSLSKSDAKQQKRAILRTRKLYKRGKYLPRPMLRSFRSKPSGHVARAKKIYNVKTITASNELARKTKCTRKALAKIVEKGEGAFFSSGSRPNQTAQSWGRARLASAITGGNASFVDYDILKKGCKPSSLALQMAQNK